jgi:hypothetical protein
LHEVLAKDYTWSFLAHDWSSVREDPEMSGIRAFVKYARQQRDVTFMTHAAFYEQALAERSTTGRA